MEKIVIKGKLPGMNEIIKSNRTNRFKGGNMKSTYTQLVKLEAIRQCCQKFSDKVYIMINYYEPDNRRDDDNVHAGAKFILDGLKAAGIIIDDRRKYVALKQNPVIVDRQNPRIEIFIEEFKKEKQL